MNWNRTYKVYEVIALLIIALVWIMMLFSPQDYSMHFKALQSTEEQGLTYANQQVQKDMLNLRKEVKKQGNSREGRERIKRFELLMKQTREAVNYLESLKTRLYQGQNVQQLMFTQGNGMKVVHKMAQYFHWVGYEFRDLNISIIDYPSNTTQWIYLEYDMPRRKFIKKNQAWKKFAQHNFANSSPEAVTTLLTTWQYNLKMQEQMVMKKLGAGDLSTDLHPDAAGGVFVAQPLRQIPVGDELTAEVVIENFYGVSRVNPRFLANNIPVVINAGKGKVQFVPQTIGKQYWEARFIIKSRGRDSSIVKRTPFVVLPPKKK